MSDKPSTAVNTFELELDDDLLSEAMEAVERRMRKPSPVPGGDEIEIEIEISDEDGDGDESAQDGPTSLEKMLAKENNKLLDRITSLESKIEVYKTDAFNAQETAKDAVDTMRMQSLKARRTVSAADAVALELEDARSNVAANEKLANELRGALRTQQADHAKSRERLQKSTNEEARQAVEHIFHDLLDVMDNLDRATQHLPEKAEDDLFVTGVLMTVRQLEKNLRQHGMLRMNLDKGTAFDPQLHEAIGRVVTNKVAINHIVEVHQMGYTLNGRLLRPAKVSVSTEAIGDEE